MSHCWEQRGCDKEMQSYCPHNTPGELCPGDCLYAICSRPTHAVATDFEILLNPNIDREACVKTVCRSCEFFLTSGPEYHKE